MEEQNPIPETQEQKSERSSRSRLKTINRFIHRVSWQGRYFLDMIVFLEDYVNADFMTAERKVHLKLLVRGLKMCATATSKLLSTFM